MKRLIIALLLVVPPSLVKADTLQQQDALCDPTVSPFPPLIGRVKQAIVKAAIAIQTEANSVANHLERATFAFKVLHDPNFFAPNMCRGAVSDGTTNSASTDGALDTRIAGIWDAFAKVDP